MSERGWNIVDQWWRWRWRWKRRCGVWVDLVHFLRKGRWEDWKGEGTLSDSGGWIRLTLLFDMLGQPDWNRKDGKFVCKKHCVGIYRIAVAVKV
jgi:hypothetical protein